MGKRVGFTARTSEHSPGMYINIPNNTVDSKKLEPGKQVEIQVKNMKGKSIITQAKCQGKDKQLKLYIGKKHVEELGLEDKELVDVFME